MVTVTVTVVTVSSATGFSGETEFMRPDNSYSLEYDLVTDEECE
jgi:hypothetical protein